MRMFEKLKATNGAATMLLFGEPAGVVKQRWLIRILVVILLLDFASKAAALTLLEPGNTARVMGNRVELTLAFNPTGMGTELSSMAAQDGVDWAFGVTLAQAVLFGLAIPFAASHWPTWAKVAFYLSLIFACELLGEWVGHLTGGHPGDRLFAVVKIAAVVLSSVVALRLVRAQWAFLLIAAMVSSSMANGINLLLDPRGVTDFVYVPALSDLLGVANVADYVMVFSYLALLLWGVLAVTASLLYRLTRGAAHGVIALDSLINRQLADDAEQRRMHGRAPA